MPSPNHSWITQRTCGPRWPVATNTKGAKQFIGVAKDYLLDAVPAAALSSIARNATPLRPLVAHGMASN